MRDVVPEKPHGETGRTTLEHLEALSDQAITALTPRGLLFELDLLFDQVVDKYGKYQEVKNELRATERLQRLAEKHEDAPLAQGLSEDAAYLRTVVPLYQGYWSRRIDQWHRLWRVLDAHINTQRN
jgi:Txe/YoeB family toxin of Txe-Axe toxin-antitoxin module